MGFLDIIKNFLGSASGSVKTKMERIQTYKNQYDRLDDEQLLRKYKNSSGDQQLACGMLLKERGYGN